RIGTCAGESGGGSDGSTFHGSGGMPCTSPLRSDGVCVHQYGPCDRASPNSAASQRRSTMPEMTDAPEPGGLRPTSGDLLEKMPQAQRLRWLARATHRAMAGSRRLQSEE